MSGRDVTIARKRRVTVGLVLGVMLLAFGLLLGYLGQGSLTVDVDAKGGAYVEVFVAKTPDRLDERQSSATFVSPGERASIGTPLGPRDLGTVQLRVSHASEGALVCSPTGRLNTGRATSIPFAAGIPDVPIDRGDDGRCVRFGPATASTAIVTMQLGVAEATSWVHASRRLSRFARVAGWLGALLVVTCFAPAMPFVRRLGQRVGVLARWDASRWYLVLALVFGFAYVAIRPPGAVPDELAHLTKAMAVADGHLIGGAPDGAMEPVRPGMGPFDANWFDRGLRFSRADLASTFAQPLACVPTVQPNVAASALSYAPLPYLVGAGAFRAVCAMHGSFGAFHYLATVLNLLMSVALTWFAIRLAGSAGWMLAAVSLLPINLMLAGSFSSDSFTLAISAVFIAAAWAVATRQSAAGHRQLAIIVASAWCIAFTKPGYVWILPLALVTLPAFARVIQRVVVVVFAMIVPLVLHAALLMKVSGNSSPRASVVPADNLHYLAEHPFHIFSLWWHTLFSDTGWYLIRSAVGRMEWRDVTLSTPITLLALAALVIAALGSVARDKLPSPHRLTRAYVVALGIAGACALTLPLYVTWTSIESPFIQGLQGRYFLVVIATLGVGLSGWKHQSRHWVGLLPVAWCILLVAGGLQIYSRYYGT